MEEDDRKEVDRQEALELPRPDLKQLHSCLVVGVRAHQPKFRQAIESGSDMRSANKLYYIIYIYIHPDRVICLKKLSKFEQMIRNNDMTCKQRNEFTFLAIVAKTMLL